TGQVRKKLLDGITQPDNDSSADVHHTFCARAEFGRQMFATFGPTLPALGRRNVRENRHHLGVWPAGGTDGS
ncbi:hypothetical protein, partial [Actinoplanes sp. NPDC089786]|uniref:hypothetical protein n=1 Tax=Actinoplanes sp. NPDC089786 TaxID=3155185 RepID=UPI00343B4BFC